MTDTATALANLQAAIEGSLKSPGSFTLNSAYLTAGLNDPSVAVQADFDAIFAQSFQIAATAFRVVLQKGIVSPVANGQFTVSGASVPIIGGAQSAPAILLFSTSTATATGATVLIVQIASSPIEWNWTTSFPYANGFPFDQVPLTVAQFYFSTASGFYPWGDTNGVGVTAGMVQTLQAKIAFPESASSYLALFAGLVAPDGNLAISGVLDLSLYGGPDFSSGTILPGGTFTGILSSEQYTFANYLEVSTPALSLIVPQPAAADLANGDVGQAPTLIFSTDLLLEGAVAGAYQLQVQITPETASGHPTGYGVSLVPLTQQLLGPADAIALVGGKGSFFDGTPAYLQQYLTSFGLAGTTITGMFGEEGVTVDQVTVRLGTPPGKDLNWQPLPAPTPKFSFIVHDFALDWRVFNPFAAPEFSYLFRTSFTILPTVFKNSNGNDGVFDVQFTSDQTFMARFDGTASLTDFLNTVSGGLVPSLQSIPIDARVSDITLQLNTAARSFAFSSDVEVDFSFLKGNDIFSISSASVNLSAVSASGTTTMPAGKGTVWAGSFSGLVTICGLSVNVDIGYDGKSAQPGWTLAAALDESVNVSALISQFFPTPSAYSFPSFLIGDLHITSLAATCFIPNAHSGDNTYTVSTTFNWQFSFVGQTVGIDDAAIAVIHDGTLSCRASATWTYPTLNLALSFDYSFETDGNSNLSVTWEGFTATYAGAITGQPPTQEVSFTLKGWSLGTLISRLMTTLGEPYFSLPSPWDLLNQISLDGLKLTIALQKGAASLTGTYTLSTPLNLGFLIVNGLSVTRNSAGEVRLSLDVPFDGVPPTLKSSLGTLTDPTGQSVKNMPTIPGHGSEYFQLKLLALGQRIAIADYDSFDSTQAVIAALELIPSTENNQNHNQNPIVPTKSTTKGAPYYAASSNWLIALDFNLLKMSDVWVVELKIVFNDPNLYGLRLAVNGNGLLAGFVIDVLYKKITNEIGLFQVDFTFPNNIRNLNFGAVSVVLPSIGVQIYTNGDFTIDLGFPYNMDFSKSFSVSAIVFGVPVLGSGGLYFGKLSNATATLMPPTKLGSFNPVIVFGLGLQVGLGYNFTAGPLSAGFALTEFGIIEGVIATYHPYPTSPSTRSSGTVQETTYFYLQGTVGLIGMLYGTVDFKIITASVMVNITLSVSISYESFEPIYINASASVRVSVQIKINLGLFSIKISMSYNDTVSVSFVINLPDAGTAPWYGGDEHVGNTRLLSGTGGQGVRGGRRARWHGRALPIEFVQRNRHLYARAPRPSRLAATDTPKKVLKLLVAPQFTVLAPEGATSYASQQGAFVCQFAMDAPDPTAAADNGPDALNSSFELLCASFFPWLIDLMVGEIKSEIDLVATAAQNVTLETLQNDLHWITAPGHIAFTTAALLTFLSDAFTLNIVTTPPADGTNHILFPMFDGLVLTVPDSTGGAATKTITLETYTVATPAHCSAVAATLRQAAASTAKSTSAPPQAEADTVAQSMASLVFVDVFTIIARALLQAGVNAFGNYAYPLPVNDNNHTDSIDQILVTLNGYGNAITVDDIAVPNADYDLNAGVTLSLSGLTSVIQTKDTLATVAARYSDPDTQASRWSTTPADLIITNGCARILQAGVPLSLTVAGQPVSYTTLPGDRFHAIAIATGQTLSELSAQSSLYGLAGLLAPTTVIAIAPVAYLTAGGDTLDMIAHSFSTTASLVGLDNAGVVNLFSPGEIAVASLEALPISQVWTSITATREIAQAGGQVASFIAAGLRLPMSDGLTLSPAFLYPTQQRGYALSQLSGQQFPTPAEATSYAITLGRAAKSHGVDLSFITFGGSGATSIEINLSDAFGLLTTVLDYAKAGKFVPAPIGANVPLVLLQPRQYTNAGYAMWSTSDYAALEAVTGAGGNQVVATPYVWSLPKALVNALQNQQARLGGVFDPSNQADYEKIIRLMPAYQPQKGVNAPNDPATTFTDLADFAYAMRVDFQITRLSATTSASSGGQSTSTAGANDSPIYQLLVPSAGDAKLLEYLLTGLSALGPDLISGLFVLYSAGGSNVTTLTGQADSAFLSFITQTNLSTQSHPGTVGALALLATEAAVVAPTGIANSPSEFITLLWEQSVVKGGGYYFYWEQLASGTGLPAEIFDDSGTATLTLVVTLAPGLTIGADNALANFVNAFVTTDNIDPLNDVVVVESCDTAASSAPLAGGETLTAIAATYGVGIGALARSNRGTALVTGTKIPISGILHQLTAAETQNSAQTLNTLATYYSVGAQTPITGNDITAANRSVTIAAGATFTIPPITYVVNPALNPGPGASFQTLSDYYGLAVEGIAMLVAAVPGLFVANTIFTIDTLSQVTQATQPPDNLSFTLSRANLGMAVAPPAKPTPTPQQLDTFSQQALYTLYNSLSAGLAANRYFNASPLGLPFGPQAPGNSGNLSAAREASASARPARRKRLSPRQAALVRSQDLATLAAEPDYQYNQVLSFAGTNALGQPFSKVNPAPAAPATGLPPAADNPYIGIGTYACVALRWQDLFGNITVTPFELVPDGYSGRLNNAPAPLRYSDRLTAISSWPKTRATYIYSGTKGSPILQLSMSLDILSYYAQGQAIEVAKQDLATYTSIYFQLNQDYTGLNVPGITGNAVTMTVSNSLLATPDQVLSDAQAQVIRDFVSACVVFLYDYVNHMTMGPAPKETLSLPFDISGVAAENLVRLDLNLTMSRNAALVEPLIADLADGLAVCCTIPPYSNAPDPTNASSYTAFAAALETCMQSSQWYMRTGAGLSTGTAGDVSRSDQLYALRFGTTMGAGIHFDIGADASYYAPLPVATSLKSHPVELTIYATGGATTQRSVNFVSIDLNLWFESCLSAIDKFLSARYASSAFVLDRLNGPTHASNLDAILGAKKDLADAISATAAPILSSSATDAATLAAAQNAIKQQLLDTLAPAFTAGTVMVFGLSSVSGADSFGRGGPPSLYGQPVGISTDESSVGNQNYTLSPASLPLAPSSAGEAPRLAFNMTTKNVDAQSYIELKLSYQITHMEFDRSPVPGIQNYVESQWLAFINPMTDVGGHDHPKWPAKSLGTQYVPVLDRALPVPPTVQTQTAEFGNSTGSTAGLTPAQLAIWCYGFTYSYCAAAQDDISITITLNASASSSKPATTHDASPLFTALADFITNYPAISADLDTYLLQINGKTQDAALIAKATAAVAAFQTRVTTVAAAYAKPFSSNMERTSAGATTLVAFDARLERDVHNNALVCLRNVSIGGTLATYCHVSRTITNGLVTLSAPVVEILPDQYSATAVKSPPDGVTLAYTYPLTIADVGIAPRLTFVNAQAEALRTISLPNLNVMVHNNARATLLIKRNTILTPDDQVGVVSTMPTFLYQTPEVTFSTPILPRITWKKYPLRQLTPTHGSSVTDYMTAFFSDLFAGASGTLRLGMSGGYSYKVAPNVAMLPKTYLPINLLQPVDTKIDSATAPTAVIAVAQQVNDWFETTQPSTASGAMDFKLSLFADSSTEQLLFVIDDLYFSTSE